jgi:hypothetical protein
LSTNHHYQRKGCHAGTIIAHIDTPRFVVVTVN